MLLGAAALSVGLFLLAREGKVADPSGPARDPAARGPEQVRVLCGGSGGLEVLVCARFHDSERAAFTDQSLARALESSGPALAFLQILVANGTGAPVTVEPGDFDLRDASDRPVKVMDLHIAAGDRPAALPVVAALVGDSECPVQPGHARGYLVAIPSDPGFGGISRGTVHGLPLTAAMAGTEKLEEWLDAPRVAMPLLAAVLESAPPVAVAAASEPNPPKEGK